MGELDHLTLASALSGISQEVNLFVLAPNMAVPRFLHFEFLPFLPQEIHRL